MAREYSVKVQTKKGNDSHETRLFARAEDVAEAVRRVLADDLSVYDNSVRVGAKLTITVLCGEDEVDSDDELSI